MIVIGEMSCVCVCMWMCVLFIMVIIDYGKYGVVKIIIGVIYNCIVMDLMVGLIVLLLIC